MRRVWLLIAFIAGVVLAGCTLNTNRATPAVTPRVVTATLGFTLDQTQNQIATPDQASPVPQIVILSTAAPTSAPSATPTPERTLTPAETAVTGPSATPPTDATVEAMVDSTLGALATQTSVAQTPASTAMLTATVEPTLPLNTSTPSATPTPTSPPTFTPLPTAIPPTRTRPGPPTVAPLDDGSGNLVPGTGSEGSAASPVAGVDTLPETLYFMSDQGSIPQVWRLRLGFDYPQQLTFSPNGVASFDVSPDGTLAYLTPSGDLIIGGIPFLPPVAPDGTFPGVSALAWSPGGEWLAYTLQTASAASSDGTHTVDGLWIRNAQGSTVMLEPSSYGADQRIFSGPLDWRPDGSEILVRTSYDFGDAYSRVNITTEAVTPLWNESTLLPSAYTDAVWNVNGNAIIASGAGAVFRVEPDTLAAQIIPGTDAAGLNPHGAQQFANGTVTFVGGTDTKQLYVIALGQNAPRPVTRPLTKTGARVDFLWDNLGQETLIVVTDRPNAPLGTAYLRATTNDLYDLTPLTGPVASPQWGPTFRSGDIARVHTTEGDTLNVRAAPGGDVLIALVSGSRVTITGGPRWYDGLRWWRIQTPNGVSGWAVESVTDDQGQPLRTLLPIAN
jgi:hypothetical protein